MGAYNGTETVVDEFSNIPELVQSTAAPSVDSRLVPNEIQGDILFPDSRPYKTGDDISKENFTSKIFSPNETNDIDTSNNTHSNTSCEHAVDSNNITDTGYSPTVYGIGGCNKTACLTTTAGELCTCKREKIYIGGLFDLTGSRGEALGQSELTSAKLAVYDVNKENILEGYELVLLHNDTQCDPGAGMDALYDLIYRKPQMHMVIGSACSEVTKTLAEIVPYWNLILVSYASTSPALSERAKYKTFFRLAPADTSQNIPRAMFITHFHWDTVAILYESGEDHSLAVDVMGSTFEEYNITIKISTSFRNTDDIQDNLQAIKKQDARIILGVYSEKSARQVLCQAYKLSMYGPRYVWIIIGDYVVRWWDNTDGTQCSHDQLTHAAAGYFSIDSLNSLSDDDKRLQQFISDYRAYGGSRPMSPYSTSTYDTVWAVSRIFKYLIETQQQSLIEEFEYGNTSIAQTYFNIMQQLLFLGISGSISFEGPDRKGISVVSQNQGGYMTRVALFNPETEVLDFNCRACKPVIWNGNRTPRDKTILVPRRKKVSDVAFTCVSSVSSAGLILASCFLSYNLYHRKLRYIKLSSPNLNNMAVIGCMLVYAGIIVLGYDDSELQAKYFPYWCTVRAFLFSSGFSMAFGAMFTKTYRVHQIFTRANRGLIKNKLLRDKHLLFIVGALLVVDSLVLLVWGIVDPMQKHVTNITMETAEHDIDLLYISQLTTCYSEHLNKWTYGLYTYKGLLLIFGVYMAWETRSVNIPALNDSRYIGMNVYNVVMMSVLVVTLSNILSHKPTLAYVLESTFMLISTTLTLCLLFVPKIYAILMSEGEPDVAAPGITVDSTCRRFAVDEKRDLFYRAEVQNRVYKREIVKLDEEIVRLERLLELPIEPYPCLTKELLFLLPESRVDPSPTMKRRFGHEKDICNSISDAGDICMGISEERSDDAVVSGYCQTDDAPAPKPFHRRATRLSIRVTNYAYSKLCKLKPRFSVGNVNFKPDYEDLKATSPISPDDIPYMGRKRSSHVLMRQEAIEERKNAGQESKQSSEKSEPRTFETQLTDDDVTYDVIEFNEGFDTENDSKDRKSPIHELDNVETTKEECSDVADEICSNAVDTTLTSCSDHDNAVAMTSYPPQTFGNTLNIPTAYIIEEHKVSVTNEDNNQADNFLPVQSKLESERRSRIKKLQSDLKLIQKDLQDLDNLEYQVSVV